MSGLLDPLDEPQDLLLRTVWAQFAQTRRFPGYHYVEYVMRRAGHNAEAVLATFPTVGSHLRSDGYSAVGSWNKGRIVQPDGPVWLTIAGLHHVGEDISVGINRSLLAYMRVLAKAQEQILRNPFEMPDLRVDLRDAVERSGEGTIYLPWASVVADQEWPGIRYTHREGTDTGPGEAGCLTDADFHTTDDYLAAVAAALDPPPLSTALPYLEPRALVRTLSFLDVTHELVVGTYLVERPPVDRSSLLVLPVRTEAEFTAGITVLSELLGKLNVPKTRQQPPHALARLEEHLAGALHDIDRAAVRDAVHTLDQIRVLRNSNVHPKPDAALLQAHRTLGLTFPVNDFATAWDSLRAAAEHALSSLQEAIHATHPQSFPPSA